MVALVKRRSLSHSYCILIVSSASDVWLFSYSHLVTAQQPQSYMPQAGMYGNYMPRTNMFMGGPPLMQSYTPPIADLGKGKGKSREADFEAAFAQAAAFLPQESATSQIVEVDDGVSEIDEAFKSTSLQDSAATSSDFKR